jgi:proline racemase
VISKEVIYTAVKLKWKTNPMMTAQNIADFKMDTSREILTIDSHTAGESTRLIVGGVGPVAGTTLAEKLATFKRELDPVRCLLTQEPRGGSGVLAALVTEGVTPGADFGLIYMDAKRYPYLCGHGTIGAVVTLVKTGTLKVADGENSIIIDTPAGPMTATAVVRDNTLISVAISMVPAFVHSTGNIVDVPGFGPLLVDLVFAGGFFAMVSSRDAGIPLGVENGKRLVDLGMRIIDAANDQLRVFHPERPEVTTVDVAEFYDPDMHETMEGRNVVVYGESHMDRSPCGTGTTAKLALLHHHGRIKPGQTLTNYSPLNTAFEAEIIDLKKVGAFDAVVVQIRGTAHITGVHRFFLDPDDPFQQGFML